MNIFFRSLVNLDHQIFLSINHLPHNDLLYYLAQLFSGAGTAGLIWYLLILVLIYHHLKRNFNQFLLVLSTGGIAWLIAEYILKPLFSRSRPPVSLGAIILGFPLTDYSFPSGHATTSWALAFIMSKLYPKYTWIYIILATLISFSRIYLGKHYPSDTIGGLIIGLLIGQVMWIIYCKFFNGLKSKKRLQQ